MKVGAIDASRSGLSSHVWFDGSEIPACPSFSRLKSAGQSQSTEIWRSDSINITPTVYEYPYRPHLRLLTGRLSWVGCSGSSVDPEHPTRRPGASDPAESTCAALDSPSSWIYQSKTSSFWILSSVRLCGTHGGGAFQQGKTLLSLRGIPATTTIDISSRVSCTAAPKRARWAMPPCRPGLVGCRPYEISSFPTPQPTAALGM